MAGARGYRFAWLVGDPGRDGRCRPLPVDAFYPELSLVIEYRERQHEASVPFFDRRHTISGVPRGEQRRLYDERRDREIPAHGLRLVVITPWQLGATKAGRLRRRDRATDLETLGAFLPAK